MAESVEDPSADPAMVLTAAPWVPAHWCLTGAGSGMVHKGAPPALSALEDGLRVAHGLTNHANPPTLAPIRIP